MPVSALERFSAPSPPSSPQTGLGGPENRVSVAVLGEWIGRSPRAVRDLANAGHIPPIEAGMCLLRESISSYCQFVRGSDRRAGTGERERLIRAQADGVERKNMLAARELIPAAEVIAEWSDILTGIRARFLGLHNRLRAALPHLAAEDVAVIQRAVRDDLEELSSDGV